MHFFRDDHQHYANGQSAERWNLLTTKKYKVLVSPIFKYIGINTKASISRDESLCECYPLKNKTFDNLGIQNGITYKKYVHIGNRKIQPCNMIPAIIPEIGLSLKSRVLLIGRTLQK